MAIYKPTNCHPFADAIDITRAFLTVEKKENGTWGVKQPDPVYLTCKLETGNTSAIGYKVRLYVGGNLAFEGTKVSPINELPAFADDATVNSGVNGTYLAIPFIQHGNAYILESYNSMYLTGSNRDYQSSDETPCFKCDYFVGDKINGTPLSGDDNCHDWEYDDSDDYFYINGGWDGKLNGGYIVEEGDVVCLSILEQGDSYLKLCYVIDLGGGKFALKSSGVFADLTLGNTLSGLLCIRKGAYCGLYQWNKEPSDPASLSSNIDWSQVFSGIESLAFNQDALSGFGDSQLSWEIELYQGPEDYSSLVTTSGGVSYITSGAAGIPAKYFDMQIASGQILGSCATRLHLGTMFDTVDNMLLPGEDLQDPLVLQDTFCELFNMVGYRNGVHTSERLVPSFPVSQFDSSLGIIYPKDGYITQSTLEAFRDSSSGNTGYDGGKFLGARFYKYSSNMKDTLSSEKVRVCYYNVNDVSTDPSNVLVAGNVVDGIMLDADDRVLWNTGFDSGKQNGLWVVASSGVPGRPADGDDYADYIGKVILVTEGTKAGTVMQSDAVAGFAAELGEVPLFFQEQQPIRLHNHMQGTSMPYILTDINLSAYYKTRAQYSGTTAYVDITTYPLPVADGTTEIIARLYYTDSPGGDTPSTAIRDCTVREVYVRVPLDEDRKMKITRTIPTNSYLTAYMNYTVVPPSIDHPIAWLPYYIEGIEVPVAATPSTDYYTAQKGLNAGISFFCKELEIPVGHIPAYTKITDLEKMMDDFQTEVLFNSTGITYVSPSSSVTKDMILRLKYGAMATISGQSASADIPIASFDGKFNRITHSALTTPLPSAKNDGVVPATPYRYDVMSCFRVSDLNGFVSVVPLTPYLAPADYDGKAVAGYSIPLDGICFQPGVENWEAARVVYALGNSEDMVQDTGWFTDKGLDVELMALEPGSSYPATLYLKDSYGRVTASSRIIEALSEDDPVNGFVQTPSASATDPTNGTATVVFCLRADKLGTTDPADLTLTVDTTGSDWTVSSATGSAQYDESTDTFDLTAEVVYTGYDVGAKSVVLTVACPNGTFICTLTPKETFASANYAFDSPSSYSLSPEPHLGRTALYNGTLTATLDCSTQSVVLEYVPLSGEYTKEQKNTALSLWPEGLPFEENGSFDVFRREYAEFQREGCPYQEANEGLWYGNWQPVVLDCGTNVVRDFNVKQGHSYQYAILPKHGLGPSLKVEEAVGTESTETDFKAEFRANTGAAVAPICRLPINVSAFADRDLSGAKWSIALSGSKTMSLNPTYIYSRETLTGMANGQLVLAGIRRGSDANWFPITITVTLEYLGYVLRTAVTFTDQYTFTTAPVGDSVGSYGRLMANDGDPVYVQWDAWSLVELEEVDPESLFGKELARHPFVKKAYKADLDKIWLFRYDMDNGAQTINMTKSEITTLGKYPRFSSGMLNAESGDVSAWLGSEVVPGTRLGYVERRRSTIWAPAATNEAAAMLAAFREMVVSDNPKLLRDRKGRSWIVQTASGSSSVMDTYVGKPAKVSFSWKQIGTTGPFVAIWGDGDALPELDKAGTWAPKIILRND